MVEYIPLRSNTIKCPKCGQKLLGVGKQYIEKNGGHKIMFTCEPTESGKNKHTFFFFVKVDEA